MELTIVEKPTIATAISLGFPLDITRADDDFYALAVAGSAFGEHRTFNGRLMKNMRGKRGLNYGDYAYIENFIQDGPSTFVLPGVPRRQQLFSIWIRPVPHDKGVFALRQALRELDHLVKDGLTEEEFEATRNFLFHYSKLWVQTQSRRVGYDLDGQFYGRASLVEELARRLPTMTREQVNAAIRKHLQAKNVAIAVVTDDAGLPRSGPIGQADTAGLRHGRHPARHPGRRQGNRIVAAANHGRPHPHRPRQRPLRAVKSRMAPRRLRECRMAKIKCRKKSE